jgi:hypothetical protein
MDIIFVKIAKVCCNRKRDVANITVCAFGWNRPSRLTLRQQRNQIKARIKEAHTLAKACLDAAQTAEEGAYLNQIVSIIVNLEAETIEAIPAYGLLS